MPAVKSDKSNVNVANEDEDEDAWLYGVKFRFPSRYTTVTDDREEKAEDQVPYSTNAMSFPKEDNENRVDTQAVQDEEESDDSDCDDNFCVTIGEIKPGGSPQSIGSDHTPVNLKIQAEERMHAVVDSKSKGVDVGALGSIHRIPVLEVDVESFEEKPWKKPGADITDYFNYGFNEETWTTYCEKQRELRATYESMTSSSVDQKGRTGNRQKESWCDCPSADRPYTSASRKSGDTDVTGDQTGSISRVEGRLRHSDEEHDVQVISEGEKMTSLFPFNLSLPAPLPPPSEISSAPPLIPPPSFPHHPGASSPFLMHTLNTACSRDCDCPPVPPYPFSTGAYPPMPKSVSSLSGMIDSAKVWEYRTRHCRDHNKGRDRSREGGRDKDRDRGRDRERDHSPSLAHNSEEERIRHRDATERWCDRRRCDRFSRDKKQRQREWRRRDNNKGWYKASCSNERRRKRPGDDDEDEDGHDRHKHKNGKRRRGDRLSSSPEYQ